MSANKDLYGELGLQRSASPEEIKKAYRTLAKQHHPDVNKDPGSEAKFKKINEAYETLSDPNKKAQYDQFGSTGPQMGGGRGGFHGGINLDDLMNGGMGGVFEDMFGFRTDPNAPRKGRNIAQRLNISLEDAYSGTKVTIRTPNGENKTIDIPKGIRSGQELRLGGYGEPGHRGGPSGDLHLRILVSEHSEYEVRGTDLLKKISINYLDLLETSEITLPFLDGNNISVKIPQFHNPESLLRIKGKGMTVLNSSGKGDLYIKVELIMPKKLSKKAKQLALDLQKEIK